MMPGILKCLEFVTIISLLFNKTDEVEILYKNWEPRSRGSASKVTSSCTNVARFDEDIIT